MSPRRRPVRKAPVLCRVFAYGTLLDGPRQQKLFGRTLVVRPGCVRGWERRRCVGRYFGLVRQAGARTGGAVLLLSRRELAVADRWECVPRLYVRRRLRVQVGRERVRCWTYLPAAATGPR